MKFKTPDPHLKDPKMARLVAELKAMDPHPRGLGEFIKVGLDILNRVIDGGKGGHPLPSWEFPASVSENESENAELYLMDIMLVFTGVWTGMSAYQAKALVQKFLNLPFVQSTHRGEDHWEIRFISDEKVRLRAQRNHGR